jgi:hypothetical protein
VWWWWRGREEEEVGKREADSGGVERRRKEVKRARRWIMYDCRERKNKLACGIKEQAGIAAAFRKVLL